MKRLIPTGVGNTYTWGRGAGEEAAHESRPGAIPVGNAQLAEQGGQTQVAHR